MKRNVFINLSNHHSDFWSKKQSEEANKYGEIIDIQFPDIDPSWDNREIDPLVEEFFLRILQYENPVVMLQGEFVFVFKLVTKLKEAGIKVVVGTTKRKTTEKYLSDGRTRKEVLFEFVKFREY